MSKVELVIEIDEEDFEKIKEEGFTVGNGMLAISKLVHGRPLEDYLFPHQDKHIDEWLEGARKNGQFISEHMKGEKHENT